jgi:hypothetical protein
MEQLTKKILTSQQRQDRSVVLQVLKSIECSVNKDIKHRISKVISLAENIPEAPHILISAKAILKRFQLQEKAVIDLQNELDYEKLLPNIVKK